MFAVRGKIEDLSERRACQVLKMPRSSLRYEATPSEKERKIVARLHELARERPRFGALRATVMLRNEGFVVNKKRVARLRRREGLKVRKKQHKRRRLGSAAGGIQLSEAVGINDVWSYDFVSDQTEDGRTLRMLVVVDEFTREALALEVGRHFTSADVLSVLECLIEVRGAPKHIRSDNGPEFVAKAVRKWLAANDISALFIEPGSPWQNAYVESFNSKLRDELLDRELFTSLDEARMILEDYRLDYNHRRPHSSLDYRTPATFAARLREDDSAPALRACATSPSRDHTPV